MLPDKDIKCPATGFAKSCHSIVTKCRCPKWVSVKGSDPQTGVVFDSWGCVDTFLPMLLVENAQMSRQTGAAVERLGNIVVQLNGGAAAVQRIVLSGDSPHQITQSTTRALPEGPQESATE